MVRTNLLFALLIVIGFQISTAVDSASAQADLKRMQQINPDIQSPLPIDEKRVAASGIRKLVGKHVTLYTDIRQQEDIDELPGIFDKAVPQWCEYFGIESKRAEPWHVKAIVMGDDQKFKAAGLLVDGMPQFAAGIQIGHEMWVYVQPGNYYTRHLLLHEGTHAFMRWFLGGLGAPWYTEGMAELIGIHSWRDSKLELNFRLTDRSQAEYWGRIKIIKEDRDADKRMTLSQIFAIPTPAFREVRYYAWSWAACEFLSKHPLSKEAFSKLPAFAEKNHAQFNRQLEPRIVQHKSRLQQDWQLFIKEIDFGYEVSRAALRDIAAVNENHYQLNVGYGWQISPMQIESGQTLQIKTKGRFIVANVDNQDWPCESDGITIEYYDGRPLGQLLIGVLPKENKANDINLLNGKPVTNGRWTAETSGNVCFRINESPAKLNDNRGQLKIFVRKAKE